MRTNTIKAAQVDNTPATVQLKHYDPSVDNGNEVALKTFVDAKRLQGLSERSLEYYSAEVKRMFLRVNKPVKDITTEDLRGYLIYCGENGSSKVTVDNIRRNLSSFFNWMEIEGYIHKSPMRRIPKLKTAKVIKETISDESLEALREACNNRRDRAILEFLASAGVRVGELVLLDRNDINLQERECIVFGKGNKERAVFFSAQAKYHLQKYLDSRTDDNPALFVSLQKPHDRLEISGIEIMLRDLGKGIGLKKIHPHRLRRTVATKAIDKGMPIEQVQHLLGHSDVNTTLIYAQVDRANVKSAHRKFFG
jgi:integrase/recombinase XerD